MITVRPALAAGLLATVAAAGALLVTTRDEPAPAGPPSSQASKAEDRDLLLRVDPPPAAPPAVALSVTDPLADGARQLRTGVLYRAEWLRRGRRWLAPAPARVNWGTALDASNAAALTLQLGATSWPSAVTVYGFAGALRSDGQPAGPAEYEIDCDRNDLVYASPTCELKRPAGSLQLSLVDVPPGTIHISVTIAWLETGGTRSGRPVLYDTGTWLFTVKTR